MKEQQLHELMKLARKSPPADLTDRVMTKIAMQQETTPAHKPVMVMLYAGCFLAFLLSLVVSLPEVSLMDYTIRISPTTAAVVSALLLLYVLYRLHRAKQTLSVFRSLQAAGMA